MIKNYFLLFFRNLRRQKLFSFINLLGLTVSLLSTMLIYLYVRQEFSFDRFHHDSENIYRVNQTFIWGENSENEFASVGPGVSTALVEELPELQLITSIHTPGNFIVSYVKPNQEIVSFEEEKVLAADSNFFKMFNFPVISGDNTDPLKQAQTLVMTESTAKKYFGNENPIGKMVRLGNLGAGSEQKTYSVTAVIKDLPENTYVKFDILLSMTSFPTVKRFYWSWIWTQLETYIKLDPKTPVEQTRAKLAAIPKKYAEETLRRTMNTSYDEYIKSGKKWELFLQPLTKIHLPDEVVYNRIGDSGSRKFVLSLIGSAIFIVLLSCVNFMNLSTAQFTRRIKEASVRKILGLGKKELGVGYFAEALAFCSISLITALAAAQLLLPGFNYITGRHLEIDLLHDTWLVTSLLGLVLLMAVVSSSYPAMFLSGFNPVEAMRGKLKSGREGKLFRNGLVVFQFTISVILMICTAIVFQQLNYVTTKNPGFDRENLVVLKHVEGLGDRESFVQQLRGLRGVQHVSWSNTVPPNPNIGGDKFTAQGMNDQTFALNFTKGDESFIPALGIRLKYGRNFDINNAGDVNHVILNESAIKKMGWNLDESVIGRKLEYPNQSSSYEIIGVVADYNYWTLMAPIEPMGIFHIKSDVRAPENEYAVVKLEAGNGDLWQKTLGEIESIWKVRSGGTPFQYEFVDMAFAQTFKTQAQLQSILTVLAVLAIMIACLGLLGMIIYSLEQRSKEIGIRKVSGASVFNILTMIASGYTKLIVISFVIGAPLAWYMMTEWWLKDFSYKTTLSPMVFAAVGFGILAIAAIITAYHSIKAARMNPVEVLRDE